MRWVNRAVPGLDASPHMEVFSKSLPCLASFNTFWRVAAGADRGVTGAEDMLRDVGESCQCVLEPVTYAHLQDVAVSRAVCNSYITTT